MSDKDDKMDEANEAFGKLLSVWSNYFDDNPSNFYANTAPFVHDFVSKFDEASAAAR